MCRILSDIDDAFSALVEKQKILGPTQNMVDETDIFIVSGFNTTRENLT